MAHKQCINKLDQRCDCIKDDLEELQNYKNKKNNMIDINDFGKYRLGLTNDEIKEWLKLRWNELLSWRGKPIKKINKATWNKFWEIAGINTMAGVKEGKKVIALMYRHDCERFTNKLFLNRKTYFD